jgi:thiol-disulfide isomerase/thioredoxin
MKTIRISIIALAAFVIGQLTFSSDVLTVYALDTWRLGWMQAYLLSRILVLLLSLCLMIALISLLDHSKIAKWFVGILILGLPVGVYLAVNPPYINDWIRTGTELSRQKGDSEIESRLNMSSSKPNGLIMLVLPSCPYCIEQFETLETLAARNSALEIAVFVVGSDSVAVQEFKNHIGESEITIYPISNREEIAELSEGRFPSFLYVKNGSVIYRWSNQQFGYPALDWVEAGLVQR